jgi:hypothetical protein
VAFAMAEQPELYAPNTLPFFNPSKKPEDQVLPVLKKEASSTVKLAKE